MKNALPGIAVASVLVAIISYAPGPWLIRKPAAAPRPVVERNIFAAAPKRSGNATSGKSPFMVPAPASTPLPTAIATATVTPPALAPLHDVPASSMISASKARSDAGSLEFVGATDFILAMAPPAMTPSAAGSAARAIPHSSPAGLALPYSGVRGIASTQVAAQPEFASDNALASIMNGVPMNQSCPTSICLDPPPKGITLRVYGQYLKDTQEDDLEKGLTTSYKSTGKMAGIGFLKDWSIASTLGLSVDYLDAEVKSQRAGDDRRNTVDGYVFNAHLKTSLMDKFPVDGRLFYGILDNRGKGTLSSWGTDYAWSEDKHRSKMYGFSGKVGIPLVFGDDIKLAPEAGLQFIRLRSDGHGVDITGNNAAARYEIGAVDSKSLTVPLTIEVKKEMQQCFGTFTPRVSLGFIKEFSDSAMGVRAYNASAASRLTGRGLDGFDASQEKFYKAGAGMDLNTVGGWAVRADYGYLWADRYKNHSFTLEASRCF